MRRVVGMGAGGHAKVLIDIVQLTPGLDLIGMVDVDERLWGSGHAGVPVLGGEDLLPVLLRERRVDAAFVGVGGVPSNRVRRAAHERLQALGYPVVRLLHPHATVAADVAVGEGVVVMAGAVVNAAAVLADGVIVNSGAVVEHDCRVGAFAHVCPRACLGGGVVVGEEAFVGLGSSVIQGVRIGARAVVGAGAVVVADVPADTMVLGCPARVVKK